MIASSSTYSTVKLLDVKTGKVLYAGTTSDKSKILYLRSIKHFYSIIRVCRVRLFHLSESELMK